LDEQHLENALVQILLNAIEAQPSGGCIKIDVEETEEVVIISIFDKGEGIDEKNIPQVFNPFFTTKSTGSGLGLSLAYQIIKEHDGIIDVSSKVHKGTVVTIQFFKYGVKNG
jgi:signal transduction histidine kinase